jgi:hypothetical protein
MTTRRTTRPRRDYSEVRRFAAHRRIGHELAWYYVFWEPLLRRVGPFIVAVVVLAVAWYKIPHFALGVGCAVLALAIVVVWVLWSASDRNLQAAMNGTKKGTGLGWAVTLVVGALSAAAWAAIWGPGA